MRIGNEQFLERPTNLKHQPNFMREKNMSCPSQKPQLSQVMIDDKPTQSGRVHLMHNHDNDNNLHFNSKPMYDLKPCLETITTTTQQQPSQSQSKPMYERTKHPANFTRLENSTGLDNPQERR